MRHMISFMIIVAFTILAISGCAHKNSDFPDSKEMARNLNKAMDEFMPELDYDLNNCEAKEISRDNCYLSKALTEKNPEFCAKISNESWQQSCLRRLEP